MTSHAETQCTYKKVDANNKYMKEEDDKPKPIILYQSFRCK